MAVRTVLDRERIPGAAASRPGQRPREDTHVYVAHDLPPARVCRVVDVSDRDRRDALPERGAVVIQTGVGHPDHLPGPIEAVGPITIVRREVRLDYPVRLCIPRMDRLDRINELDGGLIGERGDQRRGDPSEDPPEISGSEHASEDRPGSASGVRGDSRMAEPRLDRLRTLAGEDDNPDIHDSVGRHARSDFPCGFVGPDPVYVGDGQCTLQVRQATAYHEPILRDVSKEGEPARRQLLPPLGFDWRDEVDHADSHPDRIQGPWDRIVPKRRNVHGPGRELKFRCPRERLRVSSVRPEDRQSSVEAACDGERSVRFEELGTRRVDFRLGRVGAERPGAAD